MSSGTAGRAGTAGMNGAPDDLRLGHPDSGSRRTYRFTTADGVCSKQAFRAPELLLVDALSDVELGRFLSLQANYGVVGVVLAEECSSVLLAESSARARRLCELNAKRHGVDARTELVADVTAIAGPFDSIAYAPKPATPISVGEQRIADGLSLLDPGGRCYLAASRETGLTRYERCLRDIADSVERIASRDGCHLLAATRTRSYEPPKYVAPREIEATIAGTPLTLVTVPGLFSYSGIDAGTRLLLETAAIEDGESVLDVCCGYGAMGTYAARAADCTVWLSDDDRVATACAECGLGASGVGGTVVTGDCCAAVAGRTFDRVLCNPPTHAGDGVLSQLFTGIHDVLAPGGSLAIVHHRDLDLRQYLDRFSGVSRLATGTDHLVLEGST